MDVYIVGSNYKKLKTLIPRQKKNQIKYTGQDIRNKEIMHVDKININNKNVKQRYMCNQM